ncbi:MAG: hypothetical protein P0Y65_20795 [Candidatus Devosia phytovorans]|uniref:Uncharacterized protein n=1 Tax=Candidatus Devosia phytovorans TaxID=3121372 RepID=A0AAJ6B0D0_9HYPH|nr:hypothetical protein [Devosia sp.]WEK04581.1 MAG: hypothetical protein P0Y65_20795 [Devosia sp.]
MTQETMSDSERQIMARLAEALNQEKPNEVVVFTRDEAEVLKEWAKFMMAWKTLGRWGASLRQVILFFGGALAFLAALRLGLLDWLGIHGVPK